MRSLVLSVCGASLALCACSSPQPRTAIPASGQSTAPASPSVQAPASRPDTSQGSGAAAPAPAAPVAPPPAVKAAAPARSKGNVKATPAVSPAPAPAPAGTAARESKPPAAAPLDLTSLEQRLRDTRAIGVFTKLSLKNQVDDLLAVFRAYHAGRSAVQLADLRQRYDLLLLKVLSLLQDGDPTLATAVSSSREAIWAILIDPKQFARLEST